MWVLIAQVFTVLFCYLSMKVDAMESNLYFKINLFMNLKKEKKWNIMTPGS